MPETTDYKGQTITMIEDGRFVWDNKYFDTLSEAMSYIDNENNREAINRPLGSTNTSGFIPAATKKIGKKQDNETVDSTRADIFRNINSLLAFLSGLGVFVFIGLLANELTRHTNLLDGVFFITGIFICILMFISCAAVSVLINIMDTNRLLVKGQEAIIQAISNNM